jgi:arylsulfate sulfotransferase
VLSETATHVVVTVTNTGNVPATLSEAVRGDGSLYLRPALSCESSLAPGGMCSTAVSFQPRHTGEVAGALTIVLSGASGHVQSSVQLSGTGVALAPGQSLLTKTANPLVALYTWRPTRQGSVAVEFGTNTTYGRKTGAVSTVEGNGPVPILVAGMLRNTAYHMRAVITGRDGSITYDKDHIFTTGALPPASLPTLHAVTYPGQTPQQGIELATASNSLVDPQYLQAYATDLAGRLIWGYTFADRPSRATIIQPIQLLPNGNMLMVLSYASQFQLPNPIVHLGGAGRSVDLIREVTLAGDPVAQMTISTLNAKLLKAGYKNMHLTDFHHDIAVLPNGHMIVIASMLKPYNSLPGYKKTVHVLGDVLIDLDKNWNVAWVWNEFDHLDVNRHPIEFPDWTHTNAVLYSPNDGDLLVSMRHQDWILKIDYDHGKGSGRIIWRLGHDGDFALGGGTGPQDWFYGQHEPSYASTATSGSFSLAMMDNGYGRVAANGAVCGITRGVVCYTTVPIIHLDEATRIAVITFRKILSPAHYSEWGGGTTMLANGDLEYDVCADPNGKGSEVDEMTIGSHPQKVWSLRETGANLYRAHRIPSLYPGVQW